MFRDYHVVGNFAKLTRNCITTACLINKNKANENLIHFKLHSFTYVIYIILEIVCRQLKQKREREHTKLNSLAKQLRNKERSEYSLFTYTHKKNKDRKKDGFSYQKL